RNQAGGEEQGGHAEYEEPPLKPVLLRHAARAEAGGPCVCDARSVGDDVRDGEYAGDDGDPEGETDPPTAHASGALPARDGEAEARDDEHAEYERDEHELVEEEVSEVDGDERPSVRGEEAEARTHVVAIRAEMPDRLRLRLKLRRGRRVELRLYFLDSGLRAPGCLALALEPGGEP